MSCNINLEYSITPLASRFPQSDFFIHASITRLVSLCEANKDCIFKCRTIGILESVNGRFFIEDIKLPIDKIKTSKIRVSMIFCKSELKSTIVPFAVQLFGSVQWKNEPVIFAKIIQELNNGTALRLNDAVNSITRGHLADVINVYK